MTLYRFQKRIAEDLRTRRLQMDLTQEGLSNRSGVPLPTLRKFERTGQVSLEAFMKLYMVVGELRDILNVTQPKDIPFTSIDDVLKVDSKPIRQRGKRT